MKEQPLFAPGQKVICANILNEKSVHNNFEENDLIEGKEYTVTNPCVITRPGKVWIEVSESNYYQLQTQFVPKWFDRYADEVLHESLKGKKVNI